MATAVPPPPPLGCHNLCATAPHLPQPARAATTTAAHLLSPRNRHNIASRPAPYPPLRNRLQPPHRNYVPRDCCRLAAATTDILQPPQSQSRRCSCAREGLALQPLLHVCIDPAEPHATQLINLSLRCCSPLCTTCTRAGPKPEFRIQRYSSKSRSTVWSGTGGWDRT